ncbi:hypothetical protein IJH72_01655, partial [Candidatus Saccharibacteria bacterium]|nr:hypothetical protein [Candidatus Saccharibacteria bacterium]
IDKSIRKRVLSEHLFLGHAQGRSPKLTVLKKGISATRLLDLSTVLSSLTTQHKLKTDDD